MFSNWLFSYDLVLRAMGSMIGTQIALEYLIEAIVEFVKGDVVQKE